MFPIWLRLGLVQPLDHGRRQLPLGRGNTRRGEDSLGVGGDEQDEEDMVEDEEEDLFDDRLYGEDAERDDEGVVAPADDPGY